MRIVIEDAKELPIEGVRPSVASGDIVDAGPAPTALIRRFAPELVVELEEQTAEPPKRSRRRKADTPANPLRAGAAVARRRAGVEQAPAEAADSTEGGSAPKRRSAKKS